MLTSDDDILEATSNSTIAVLVERSFIARLQPGDTLGIRYQGLGRLLWVMPISLGELVSGNTELAALANGNDITLGIDNLRARMGKDLADGGQTSVNAVGGECIEAGRGCLGKTYYHQDLLDRASK